MNGLRIIKGLKGANLLLFEVSTDRCFKKGIYFLDIAFKLDISYELLDQIHLKSLKSFNTYFLIKKDYSYLLRLVNKGLTPYSYGFRVNTAQGDS
jgi:hypothetical protein